MYTYKADVVRVLDGDTVELLVDLGFGMKMNTNFRLADIDCAETWRPRNDAERTHGKSATNRLIELIASQPDARQTFMNEHDDKALNSVLLRSSKHGKYRWVGELFPIDALHEKDLNEVESFNAILLREGYQKRESY